MAAAPQLVNQIVEQSGLKVVPRPNSPQAVAAFDHVGSIKVNVRAQEGRAKSLLLGTLNHADFRVVKPIPVHIESRGQTVIASWRQIDEFGTGKSSSCACDDLGHTIVELFWSLRNDEGRLGPDLQKVWGILREHVVRRDSHEGA